MGANSFLLREDPILEGALLAGKQIKGYEVVFHFVKFEFTYTCFRF